MNSPGVKHDGMQVACSRRCGSPAFKRTSSTHLAWARDIVCAWKLKIGKAMLSTHPTYHYRCGYTQPPHTYGYETIYCTWLSTCTLGIVQASVNTPIMLHFFCLLTMGSELGIRTTSLRVTAARLTSDLRCSCSFCFCCPVAAADPAARAAVDGTKASDTQHRDAAATSKLMPVSVAHADDHM